MLLRSVLEQRLRSILTIAGIVIGIASVVLLGSIGEGTRLGIASKFSQFGTTLIAVTPGKIETLGIPGILSTNRKLTLEDARALQRIPGIRNMACNVNGVARVEWGRLGRDVYTFGVIHEAQYAWKWSPRVGTFIPPGSPHQIPAVCVLGPTLARELFATENPLGKTVRIGESRFRVLGIMEPKGQFLSIDLDDAVFIPISRAMKLFDQPELHEVHLDVASHAEMGRIEREVKRVLKQRHGGVEDFTVVSQTDMLGAIDQIMRILTQGVVAIAAIAIFVGSMGILTITWISVHERTAEIGLLKAIGASDSQVMSLFLGEATLLSALGGILGVALGLGSGRTITIFFPALPITPAPWIVPICIFCSLGVGALSGLAPARRAARMSPIRALREE